MAIYFYGSYWFHDAKDQNGAHHPKVFSKFFKFYVRFFFFLRFIISLKSNIFSPWYICWRFMKLESLISHFRCWSVLSPFDPFYLRNIKSLKMHARNFTRNHTDHLFLGVACFTFLNFVWKICGIVAQHNKFWAIVSMTESFMNCFF
jgi:hypothetical protein